MKTKTFIALMVGLPAVWPLRAAEPEVDFNRHIRPILSDKCFHCHGPDGNKRKPKSDPLRLDVFEEATRKRGDVTAIVPGDLAKSELIRRIRATDPDERMPPADFHLQLTEIEKQRLTQWVKSGGAYQDHWSFTLPKRPAAPTPKNAKWVRNPIDTFVRSHQESIGLDVSPEADRDTLLRRVCLALTGLPPTPRELDAYANKSYEAWVDYLLASKRYGERMALYWLDAARYADTDGYQTDGERTMWPWRDWVIKAFNDNMPFDEFTVLQLAGDMMPEATLEMKLASAFNRNHRINNEGGALPEEYIVEYAIDRLETTSTVWLGLTVGCARCHDHKYDPISQKDFYSMYAYFNNIPEAGKAAGKSARPQVRAGSVLIQAGTEKEQAELEALRTVMDARRAKLPAELAEWEKGEDALRLKGTPASMWKMVDPDSFSTTAGKLKQLEDGALILDGAHPVAATYTVGFDSDVKRVTAVMLEAISDPSFTAPARFTKSVNGNFVVIEFAMTYDGKPVKFRKATATFSQASYPVGNAIDGNKGTGWAIFQERGANPKPLRAMFELEQPLTVENGKPFEVSVEHGARFSKHNIGKFKLHVTERDGPSLDGKSPDHARAIAALRQPVQKRSKKQKRALLKFYETVDPEMRKLQLRVDALEAATGRKNAAMTVPVMVMQEKTDMTPTYRLERGQYNAPDKSEQMARRIPASIARGNDTAPKDRLELARWIVSRENPLTARVTVNRFWQHHFGSGLVKTSEDFGAQGSWPSHPALLDWLAVEFMDSGWDVKKLHKLIVTSATYRQSSKVTAELKTLDPENRLLARGPRYRLDAASIRDQALFVGGLMSETLGGPPVKPYQPAGLWNSVSGGSGFRYNQSKGADLYRRSMYTYWKRAVAPPRLLIFDAAGREACNVRNRVTNTPLQALVLMNDMTFVEAARALAERMMTAGGAKPEERLAYGYRLATGRKMGAKQMQIVRGNYSFFKDHYTANAEAAKQFLAVGASKRDASLDVVDHAAYAAAAHLMLNLDETMTLE